MAQTTTPCPRCGGQMNAEVQQIFDVGQDPLDKERLLRGAANIAVCPSCGYQSALAIPLVYHDPDKELLLTYFPSEMGMPLPEQEKIIGPLISQVVDKLPAEKKKGYIFQPRAMLTYDTLIETILEADGITKEMLQEQKYQVDLLKRLISTPPETLSEVVKQESAHIDQNFFTLFNNMKESALQMRNKNALEAMQKVQNVLLEETEYGQKLKAHTASARKAIKDLQDLGDKLNQDTLLDLVLASSDETYLQTLAGLARNGMDYDFFTKLSSRIEKAEGETKTNYTNIREKLLSLTQEIDKALAEETEMRKQLLEEILQQENMEQAVYQAAQAIDETFMKVASDALAEARKSGDFMRSGKIQQLIDLINKLSTPPAEVDAIEKLLAAENEDAIRALIAEKPDMITDNLKNVIKTLLSDETQKSQLTPEMIAKLTMIQAVINA